MTQISLLVDEQKLEDMIVDAFKHYEGGYWPTSMRHEARHIIRKATVNVPNTDTEPLGV
jgi:hypothetical protein